MSANISSLLLNAVAPMKGKVPDACAEYAKAQLDSLLRGELDSYYASFALLVLSALGCDFDMRAIVSHIEKEISESLDIANLSSLVRALRFCGGDAKPYAKLVAQKDARNPYDVFLKIGAMQDCGFMDSASLFDTSGLENYRSKNGGFSNLTNAGFSAANSTAAALVVKKIFNENDNAAINALAGMQDSSGGFKAQEDSMCPDLLSAASAVFALRMCGVKPKYDAADFAISHYLDDGSFSATVYEDNGDCEYLFYGLLTLGLST